MKYEDVEWSSAVLWHIIKYDDTEWSSDER